MTVEIVAHLRDLVCRFGTNTVLDRVSLEVRRGEVLVVLGGSGCGKSTLLRHMVGLQAPTEGTVELFGRPLWDVDSDERDALRWGDDWIVFPNPIYGAWRSSLKRSDEDPPSKYQPDPVRPPAAEAPKMSLLDKWQG